MDWQPIESAPANTTVIVWGEGGLRFMRKDSMGQWRAMMGHPKSTPKFWLPLPEPPREAAGLNTRAQRSPEAR